jgi:hypothetical protein
MQLVSSLGVGFEFELNRPLAPSLQVREDEQVAARAAKIFLAHDVGGKQKRSSILQKPARRNYNQVKHIAK